MLVKLSAVQIPKFWEIIKFVAITTDHIKPKNLSAYNINLLQDLLSDKKSCLIAQEKDLVHFVLLIEIRYDFLRDMKYLFLSNAYSFKMQELTNWPLYLSDLLAIAKKMNCSAMIANTKNKRLIDIFDQYGGKLLTNQFVYYL